MTTTRAAAVAGAFYPADPHELASMVDRQLAAARPRHDHPKAVIVPHAGYVYSGPVAASAYAALVDRRDDVERVVLLGPSHRVPLRGMAVPTTDRFDTPLGAVAVDRAACDDLASLPSVVVDDRPHALEHSLEVHLPFLLRLLRREWTLVPVVVGDTRPDEVADALDRVWGGDETLIVVSSDLSHYHPYDTARGLDRRTADAIVARDTSIGPLEACGAHPVTGLLEVARRHDLGVQLLDLRNSGDTAGPRDRVVGYGSFEVG